MIQIYERHMVGGERHEHIAEVKWRNVTSGNTGKNSRATMVKWLDKSDDNRAIVGDYPNAYVFVGTVYPDHSPAYIRTYANGQWTDNLLALPEY